MQGDGNLVLYEGAVTCSRSCSGDSLWNSGTFGDGGASVTMQTDGNLVVYYNGVAVWNSNTAGYSEAYLQLQDDDNLVVYQGTHPLWDWASGYMGNVLWAGYTLTAGQSLISPGHAYKLIMQGEGNLVLYNSEGSALWSSGTVGYPGADVVMQGDGNLVIYYQGTAVWNTNTHGFSGAYLQLQDDDNLVVYQGSHPLWDWASGYMGNRLFEGTTLVAGQELISPGHGYDAIMQGDGNFVLYDSEGTALWSSGTSGDDGAYIVMQGDGNLVIYYNGAAAWNSGTSGHPGAFLQLQDDNNLVLYDGDTAIWDWASGLLGGGGGGPTAAETAAVNWAVAQIGSTSYYDLCLALVQRAYQDGAGLNIQPLTNYGTFNSNTYPQQVWDDGFNSGTTGGSNTTPPYGALVFFNDPSDYEYSHVTIMGSGGEMISTPDAFDESAVHYETLAQSAGSGAYSKYVGWWLPDG